ncbi:all trans-polyprenyl-diphosphate synthase PDSS2-like [Biomphalaria glabrata]|uniref:All trans-polyprenyl-diphosphate synthase PDSS2-like n=1 Tax=Biomphalaria glabrata TaxID=6526 RepID=A0A9U8EFY5_BIOGL|nr:all trans-polyprenyl-diphosphate synthase PDSS2-like [Biomphalaria glabrata]
MQSHALESIFFKLYSETSLVYLTKYLNVIPKIRSNQCHCLHFPNRNIIQTRKYASHRDAPKSFSKAVSDAEKLVGYPTSFLSLRCLLSDEVSNIAYHMRKLVGTKHPLLKTARGMVFDGKNNLQIRGLLVMLVSKAAGPNSQAPYTEQDMISGVYPSQRALAEITEVIYTASLIHKGIVNLKDIVPEDGPLIDMEFGNKMAVLSGDYLLSSACSGLAKLGNPDVVDLVARAIGDMMTAEFTETFETTNTSQISTRFTDWLKQTRLSLGSLLAHSCRSAMTLAGHSKYLEEMAFSFGENVIYAQQLCKEITSFTNQDEQTSQSPGSLAPVVLFRELASEDEMSYLLNYSPDSVYSYNKLLNVVRRTGALEKCQDLCVQYRNKAIASLDCFKESDAKLALINMVTAISSIK